MAEQKDDERWRQSWISTGMRALESDKETFHMWLKLAVPTHKQLQCLLDEAVEIHKRYDWPHLYDAMFDRLQFEEDAHVHRRTIHSFVSRLCVQKASDARKSGRAFSVQRGDERLDLSRGTRLIVEAIIKDPEMSKLPSLYTIVHHVYCRDQSVCPVRARIAAQIIYPQLKLYGPRGVRNALDALNHLEGPVYNTEEEQEEKLLVWQEMHRMSGSPLVFDEKEYDSIFKMASEMSSCAIEDVDAIVKSPIADKQGAVDRIFKQVFGVYPQDWKFKFER